ncbi:MAG: Uma2 family endonuclease [Gammaproteobacteria bacterium]|nr:Uma2 family endonuclease [Gammaproteobacteria bacterium]
MPTEPPSTVQQTSSSATSGVAAHRTSLATLHARALYRPVPPVACDDDGYPETDSAAVESTIHEKLRGYAIGALRVHYAARADFFVAADLGLFFERGDRSALVAPDLMVAFGAGHRERGSYKLWEEPKPPNFVLELLSLRTWRNDVEAKPGLYEALGVDEFWLFDPIGKLPRPINGWHLDADGVYVPVPAMPDGGYRSRVLGLDLVPGGDGFRFRDSATGDVLPDHGETAVALKASEARVAELEELLRRQR